MIIKNEDKFLNMLYGTKNENYNLNMNMVKIVLREHVKSLENIYKVIEELDNIKTEDLFNLGDIINLVDYIKKNIKKEVI